MESATHPDLPQLLAKLKKVYRAVKFVEKRGRNDHHGYRFAQALDVVRDVRAELVKQGIVVIPGVVPGSLRHFTETGGRGFVTTVDLTYTFMDADTGASITVPWAGAGADTGGDKGLYKAYTGGLKYALLSLFLLPMTEDPEHDGFTESQRQAASPSADKDAERPAAPRIPLDRARLLADRAVEAGLATWEGDDSHDGAFAMSPVLRAKLAELGVEKIGQLNVDQAEAVEAFIAQEAQA